MANKESRYALQGSCHCEAIQVHALSVISPDQISLRKCDCSFCMKHGAAYFSDANGTLAYSVKPGNVLKRYRQGTQGVADFLLCDTCGVLVGVLYKDAAGKLYSALNGTIFDQQKFAEATAVSPQKLPQTDRIERWKKLWFAEVLFK